ncbi:translocation/assembly module TamB domain-containing protein [Hoylesella oralis]|uniref:translocation/assembly module TamB domain-containing protein n=1 Tax=Hoylesella oralis TaxID=28134 RepID=UPI003606CDAA
MLWAAVGLYALLTILLHIPAVQTFVGRQASEALSRKLGTKVALGRVDLGFLNRIIIDDVCILDQQNRQMLKAARVSVKLDYLLLSRGRISISSAQLFGMRADFYKQTASAKPNFQFALDSLRSKDTNASAPIDLQIGSLIIRHGFLAYNRLDIARRRAHFSLNHINAKDISAHIILNTLKTDTINLNVKKLSLKDASGLDLRSLSFKLAGNNKKAVLRDFHAALPHSQLTLGETTATYTMKNQKLQMPTLQFSGTLEPSKIFFPDVACLLPDAETLNTPIYIAASFSGTSTSLRIRSLNLRAADGSAKLTADGSVSNWNASPKWFVNIRMLSVSAYTINKLADANKRIEPLTRLGNIVFIGNAGGYGKDIATKGIIHTNAGNANIAFGKHENHFSGRLETQGINLQKILNDDKFGTLATHINVSGTLPRPNQKETKISAQGVVSQFTYNGYDYRNINIDANSTLQNKLHPTSFNGRFSMDDPNGKIELKGNISRTSQSSFSLSVRHLDLNALKLSNNYKNKAFDFDVDANLRGNNINNMLGSLKISNFNMTAPETTYHLNSLAIASGMKEKEHFISIDSDFGKAYLQGKFNLSALVQNLENTIISKLPGIQHLSPIKYAKAPDVKFKLSVEIYNSEWAEKLLDIPVTLNQPLALEGDMDSKRQHTDIIFNAPDFTYNSKRYTKGFFHITTPNDTLKATAQIRQFHDKVHASDWNIQSVAINDNLITFLSFNNRNRSKHLMGQLNTETKFFKNSHNAAAAHIVVHPSEILVGDTTWRVQPSDIIYSKHRLTVDHFAISHNNQHIIIDGTASKSVSDSVTVDLKDVDVNYILNFVNFHSVEFSGLATGEAYLYAPFSEPSAKAHLMVNDFKFENGRMGTLYANADWTFKENQININAQAADGPDKTTIIKGYVSPAKNHIDLAINAHHTRLEFLQYLCRSFMRDVDATGDGRVRVSGDLSNINLTGEIAATGSLGITSLNTQYTMRGTTIRFEPDDIIFRNDTVYDRNGNIGIVNGHVYHRHLTDISCDLNIAGQNLLAYDTHYFGDDTFYGTAFVTGNCHIRAKSGELIIDVNATPQKGSQFVYNVASPNAINKQGFIHWFTKTDSVTDIIMNPQQDALADKNTDGTPDIPSDLHINFHIDCNQNITFKLLMDSQTGDYIALNGDGILQATYYNKGSFNIFGNYVVDHGIYKLTIQNVIKKDFQFEKGGTIAFGGNPYDAALNLKAEYTVNGVSLSDLKIGRSFTNNTIRVNCLMNISGTPGQPKIDFSLDMPTVNNDVKQMVYNLINSEEEMNQQVLYLLAIGRFYSQGQNNSFAENNSQQSQTSLAMQSILSGTVSQQINNVLSSVINNTNWNFGANISTGTEGWNNAEYEGMLNGRLLNNRLLINGQFGYRDNANATTSFIGDFDVRYLLFPSGNVAIKVYNQTNDRYFTRNSMNTQGIGIILKKDFNGLRDLFGKSRKKKAAKNK